jgi:Cu(I)/Ag(I) efflux system membrane fusion protein
LTINQEKIKTISARAMGRIEKLFQNGRLYVKKDAVYQHTVRISPYKKQDYYTAYKQLSYAR